MRTSHSIAACLALSALALAGGRAAADVPSAFSVQGVLRDSTGKLQSMMVNVTVSLFDVQTAGAGNRLAGPFGPTALMAQNGLFTVSLNDPNLVTELSGQSQVWLEVTAGNDTFPRQLVTPEIYSVMCGNADKLGGTAASGYLTTAAAAATYLPSACTGCVGNTAIAVGAVDSTKIATGSTLAANQLTHKHAVVVTTNTTNNQFTIPANLLGTSQCLGCVSGTVIGGSCTGPSTGATLTAAYINGSQWCCTYNNTSGSTVTVYATPTCLAGGDNL